MKLGQKIKKQFAKNKFVCLVVAGAVALAEWMILTYTGDRYRLSRPVSKPEIPAVSHDGDESPIEDAVLVVNPNGYTVIKYTR